MKKILFNLTLLFILSILITPSALAENSDSGKKEKPEKFYEKKEVIMEKKEEMQDKKEERGLQRCENTANRIANKIARFQANKASHIEKYNTLKAKLDEIVVNLTDKGIDTTDLEAHIAALEGMVVNYALSYAEFIGELEDAQSTACGEENGFKDNMQMIRDMFKSLMDERLAIRKYYVEIIRFDIKGIREQVRERAKEQAEDRMGQLDDDAEDETGVVEEISESEE